MNSTIKVPVPEDIIWKVLAMQEGDKARLYQQQNVFRATVNRLEDKIAIWLADDTKEVTCQKGTLDSLTQFFKDGSSTDGPVQL